MGNVLPPVQDINKDISRQKDFVREWMDPDFGLLSKLRARNALSEEEIDFIKDQSPYRKRNLKIIEYILIKNKFKELIEGLKDAKQTHLANYLISNGEYEARFGSDWPLGAEEISTIDANEEYLVDLLDTCDLLCRLFSTEVINKRQMEFISSKPTSYEKNEELLKMLRRSSLSNYYQTIKCLHYSNQSHIADIFERGGVIVKTDAELDTSGIVDVETAEEQIVSDITSILSHRSMPESNRILELVQLRLIGAKVGHSVVLYFHCRDRKEVDRLGEVFESGDLTNVVGKVFNRLLQTTGRIRIKMKWIGRASAGSQPFSTELDTSELVEQRMRERRHLYAVSAQMNDLPLELMDLILRKSYLCFVQIENSSGNSSGKQSAFSAMASVDDCWFQRLRKRRFKRRIWSYLAAFYKDVDRFAVYRINRNYFVENIQPTFLTGLLRSEDCLTDVQSRFILRGDKSRKGKQLKRNNLRINAELLHVVRSFNTETRYSDFTRCLRQSNQHIAEKVSRNGGVVIKAKIAPIRSQTPEQLMQLVRGLNDFQDKSSTDQDEVHKLMCQLSDDQIEVINSFSDRHAVSWIWSRSKTAFESLRTLDEQHDFVKLRTCLVKTPQTTTTSLTASQHQIIRRHHVDIDTDQFRKEIVLSRIVINFKWSLEVENEEFVVGVAKLRNYIYLLSRSMSSRTIVRVHQDIFPFYRQGEIELKCVRFPEDVISSEKGNCLYVIDTGTRCIWEVIAVPEANCRVTKWLPIDLDWSPFLSMSKDDKLLIVRGSGPRSRLEIYGTDANLNLSIHLPPEIQFPQHAVETSAGNFVILHELIDEEEATENTTYKWLIWEVIRSGKMVLRRFVSQDVQQELTFARHLLIDSHDQVLVADTKNARVILLDPDLRWNRILTQRKNHRPLRLCYDEAKSQLIVMYELKGLCPRIYEFRCSELVQVCVRGMPV